MNFMVLQRLAYSAVMLLVVHLLFHVLKRYAKKTQQTLCIRKSRYFAIKRLLTATSVLLSVLLLVLLWDVNVKHVWVSATGILALIAIAFFAMWSLISNILGGVIVYFTSPFKIEDTIEIMPDGIRGSVLAINTFYTVLMDEEDNYINIPNSLFFQKYIRVLRTKKVVSHASSD